MTQQGRAEWLYRKLKGFAGAMCEVCAYNTADKACHYTRCEPKEMCIEGIRQALIKAERRERALEAVKCCGGGQGG